jgi:thioredoxin-like negative regulator of GroEL
MAAAAQKHGVDPFKQSADAFNNALQLGFQMQQETVNWWLDLLGDSGSAEKLQKKAEKLVRDAIPVASHNVKECLEVLDQTGRNGLELLAKAFEAGKCRSVGEIQAKAQELWEGSLSALRANTEAVVQLNTKAAESCRELVRKTLATENGRTHAAGRR